MQKVLIKRVSDEAILPAYASASAAAVDLVAMGNHVLRPGDRQLVSTGIALEMPDTMAALVLPRSGYAVKHGITVANAPGLIDPDYRGEVKVILINHGDDDFEVRRGSRIAQLMFTPIIRPWLALTGSLSETERGHGGFGSTGL